MFLKTPPGATKVRIISDVVKFWKDFDNKKQYLTQEAAKANPAAKERYAMWVIDRADGAIKMWETSGGIVRDLQNLSENPEFAFDGLPPYDIIVTRVGSTMNDTRYTIGAARQNTELTPEEKASVEKQQSMKLFLMENAEDASETTPF